MDVCAGDAVGMRVAWELSRTSARVLPPSGLYVRKDRMASP